MDIPRVWRSGGAATGVCRQRHLPCLCGRAADAVFPPATDAAVVTASVRDGSRVCSAVSVADVILPSVPYSFAFALSGVDQTGMGAARVIVWRALRHKQKRQRKQQWRKGRNRKRRRGEKAGRRKEEEGVAVFVKKEGGVKAGEEDINNWTHLHARTAPRTHPLYTHRTPYRTPHLHHTHTRTCAAAWRQPVALAGGGKHS